MILSFVYAAYDWGSHMKPKGIVQLASSQPPYPFLPFPLYLDTLLLEWFLLNCVCMDNWM